MGLFSTLNIASTGLNASQLGVQTAGSNVANAQTPGYTRRTMQLEALSSGGATLGGVRSLGTQRVDEPFLRSTASRTQTDLANSQSKAEWLGRIESLRAPVEGSAVANAIEGFSGAFSQLAAHPEDASARESALQASEDVASAFRGANENITTLRNQMDAAAAQSATKASSLAAELASLNARISAAPDAKDSALLDQRDAVAAQLAAITGGAVIHDQQGHVNVHALGTMVVDGVHAIGLSTQPNTTTGGLELVATSWTGTSAVLTAKVSGGEIGGVMGVRNGALVQQQAALDQLAFDFGNAVNTQHAAGYGLDGVNGRNLFSVNATAAGAANSFGVAAGMTGNTLAASQTATTLPGDNRNALAIANMRSSSATDFAERERASLSALTGAASSASADAEAAQGRNDVAQSLLQQSTGVSLDEEFVNLQQYQRAYQASAKVLQTVDSLLDTLVNL